MRSKLGKIALIALVLTGGSVVAIEVANSDLLLESKTYELVAYSEVKRTYEEDQVVVLKTKRFGFMPGADTVVFVQDATGRTVDQRVMSGPAPCPKASDCAIDEAESSPAPTPIERADDSGATTTATASETHL